ncbi:hypothetical protein [Hoeflea alexandrii]|uniref:hypothetical protein n=1 Tax=Hoeflea alexandrii TaxID=288436 RepID=UPI002D1E41F1|nr:hypothetical protein [Hoeflea alexandrii]
MIPVHSGCIHSRNAIKHPYRAKTGSTQFQQGAADSFRRTLMKTHILGFLTSMAMIAGANAASITNKDAQPQVLIVTEAGNKIEMVVEAERHGEFLPGRMFRDHAFGRPRNICLQREHRDHQRRSGYQVISWRVCAR